ncbi:MAG: hypothetical protein KJ645_13230, partial [Planctomycetes bacterium]|nr:hypothetical protein [Planctomycetota bacterium]
ITFYHSPVTLIDCRIEGTRAEDGLNIFGTDMFMERVGFSGCASDSLDCDFVTGEVNDCLFESGAADGADFSGSRIQVKGCRFVDLGDKALSVGEKTCCKVQECRAERVSIGLASKDLSQVELNDFTFSDVRNFVIAVYVKKPEFGPSRVVARNLVYPSELVRPFLVQQGCVLTVDGKEIPTEDFDVEKLYDQKILGN